MKEDLPVLIIYGEASKNIFKKVTVKDNELELTLLSLLTNYSVPVASSCLGAGVCLKCSCNYLNEKILTCQKLVSDVVKSKENTIRFSYL